MPVNRHVLLDCAAPWQDQANATVATAPYPCIVRALFADGFEAEVEATAHAWSKKAVHVYFPHPDKHGPAYRVWVPIERVRRVPAD